MCSRVITHCNRCAILFIVDCSLSMKNLTRYSNTEMTKMEVATIIVNHFIDELLARATRLSNVRNYYDIGVIGYSGCEATSLLPDNNRILIDITRLSEYKPQPKAVYLNNRYPDGTIKRVSFNLHPWIEPTASGASPMYDAMVLAKTVLKEWCNDPRNNTSYPPLIFHITDSLCSDADIHDLNAILDEITDIGIHNDKTILFNVYLATLGEGDMKEEIYPREYTFATGDRDREFMYNISSSFPRELESHVSQFFEPDNEGPYRTVAFNMSPISMLSIINIGTQSHKR